MPFERGHQDSENRSGVIRPRSHPGGCDPADQVRVGLPDLPPDRSLSGSGPTTPTATTRPTSGSSSANDDNILDRPSYPLGLRGVERYLVPAARSADLATSEPTSRVRCSCAGGGGRRRCRGALIFRESMPTGCPHPREDLDHRKTAIRRCRLEVRRAVGTPDGSLRTPRLGVVPICAAQTHLSVSRDPN